MRTRAKPAKGRAEAGAARPARATSAKRATKVARRATGAKGAATKATRATKVARRATGAKRVATTREAPRLPEGWTDFYRVVRSIPAGRVTTYAAVAARAHRPRHARHVGFALSALHGEARGVPWQRVLAARGAKHAAVSIRDPIGAAIQRELLEREGVRFDARGRVSLAEFGWR